MVFLLLILFDQLTKYLIRFWGGFYICNPHVSFGITVPTPLFWLLWISLIAWLIFTYLKTTPSSDKTIPLQLNWKNIGILFMLSGALSNVIDRLVFGCVIDFIDLKIWPIFNLADVFIFFGAIIIASVIVKK